ncbi:GntR family transcriptional regulator [Streptomyces sp. NPDC004752]
MAVAAYDAIYARLLSREIAPGQRISVDRLVRELSMSQTPVRQALSTLEADGLVTSTHLTGYRAAELLTREEFDQLFEVRLLLEPVAAAAAATNRTEAELSAMRELQAEMRAEAGREGTLPYSIFAQRDGQLHELIASAGRNQFLHDSVARLHSHVHLFRLYFDGAVTAEALDEHAAVVDGIAAADDRAARKHMKDHLIRSRRRLRKAFE